MQQNNKQFWANLYMSKIIVWVRIIFQFPFSSFKVNTALAHERKIIKHTTQQSK